MGLPRWDLGQLRVVFSPGYQHACLQRIGLLNHARSTMQIGGYSRFILVCYWG